MPVLRSLQQTQRPQCGGRARGDLGVAEVGLQTPQPGIVVDIVSVRQDFDAQPMFFGLFEGRFRNVRAAPGDLAEHRRVESPEPEKHVATVDGGHQDYGAQLG